MEIGEAVQSVKDLNTKIVEVGNINPTEKSKLFFDHADQCFKILKDMTGINLANTQLTGEISPSRHIGLRGLGINESGSINIALTIDDKAMGKSGVFFEVLQHESDTHVVRSTASVSPGVDFYDTAAQGLTDVVTSVYEALSN